MQVRISIAFVGGPTPYFETRDSISFDDVTLKY